MMNQLAECATEARLMLETGDWEGFASKLIIVSKKKRPFINYYYSFLIQTMEVLRLQQVTFPISHLNRNIAFLFERL